MTKRMRGERCSAGRAIGDFFFLFSRLGRRAFVTTKTQSERLMCSTYRRSNPDLLQAGQARDAAKKLRFFALFAGPEPSH
jgi:hypothetical protein